MKQLAIAVSLLLTQNAFGEATNQFYIWGYNNLMTPSEEFIMNERLKERVTIYDGMYRKDIDNALDRPQNFDRMEYMMFVNTLKPTASGGYVEENDGCD